MIEGICKFNHTFSEFYLSGKGNVNVLKADEIAKNFNIGGKGWRLPTAKEFIDIKRFYMKNQQIYEFYEKYGGMKFWTKENDRHGYVYYDGICTAYSNDELDIKYGEYAVILVR